MSRRASAKSSQGYERAIPTGAQPAGMPLYFRRKLARPAAHLGPYTLCQSGFPVCRRLGISEEASFEEIQEARNFLYEVSTVAVSADKDTGLKILCYVRGGSAGDRRTLKSSFHASRRD